MKASRMSQGGSRKRPAPGASPLGHEKLQDMKDVQYSMAQPEYTQQTPSNTLPNYEDPTNYGTANLTTYLQNSNIPNSLPASPLGNQVVRRQPDSQIVPMMSYNNSDYPLGADYGGLQQSTEDGWPAAQYDDLDQKALIAKRDAQAKRKQIPPFIQKLSSFLDENTRNTDLIRWSESGDSFIVVDEDEFAKTLIPELFKHNNYASFVRQLNMYGFHKKVGLSDNSMRASERKNKNPSEYSNPYFKRGRPNLLWLIHKPKTAPTKGTGKGGVKARQEDVEDEGDELFNHDSPGPQNYGGIDDGTGTGNRRQPLMIGNVPNSLPPEQLVNLQRELAEIRQNQHKITEMLHIVRKEHHQLYGQAKAFHDLHEKHETSINSILTFLAAVYNKQLGQGGLDFNNMFKSGSLPSKDQEQGNIVDVGDDKDQSSMQTMDHQQLYRKQPLLIKDGSADSPENWGRTPKDDNQWSHDVYNYATKAQNHHSPAVQELSDRTPSARSSQSPQSKAEKATETQIPEADIMSMINSATAQSTNNLSGQRMEFPEALSHLQTADGQSPLTPNQRQNMLELMSNDNINSPQNGNNLNALTSYSPSTGAANLAHFDLSKEQLDQIHRSLQEQQERMANINAVIAPLSPSGSIPGVTDQSYQPNGNELDFESFLNSGEYFNDGTNPGDFDFSNHAEIPDFDFSVPPNNMNGGDVVGAAALNNNNNEGRVVGSVASSEATSPANTVKEDEVMEHTGQSPRKLRRRG